MYIISGYNLFLCLILVYKIFVFGQIGLLNLGIGYDVCGGGLFFIIFDFFLSFWWCMCIFVIVKLS